MISMNHIIAYARSLAAQFQPEKIILFGSYANGSPNEDSDVDLLIIMDHNKPRNVDQALSIRLQQDATFPLDLLVRRPADIKERVGLQDTFICNILTDGHVLHG